jgi:hypothetical protein
LRHHPVAQDPVLVTAQLIPDLKPETFAGASGVTRLLSSSFFEVDWLFTPCDVHRLVPIGLGGNLPPWPDRRHGSLPGVGRPRQITALERAQICALACQLPAQTGVPLARPGAAYGVAGAGPGARGVGVVGTADPGGESD